MTNVIGTAPRLLEHTYSWLKVWAPFHEHGWSTDL